MSARNSRRSSSAMRSGEMHSENVAINRNTLHFSDPEVEINFRIHHAKEHRKRLRFLCLAVSLASTAQFSINFAQDSLVSGYIRVVAVAMLLTVFGLTFREQFYTRVMSEGFGQHIVASALALLLVTGRILSKDDDSTFERSAEVVPTVGEDDTGFFFLTLGGLSVLAAIQYTAALTAGTLTTVWYIVAAIIWGSSDSISKMTTVVTAFFAFIVFAFVARDFELSERRDFVLTSRLKEEQVDLNLKLEGFSFFASADENADKKMGNIGHCVVDPKEVKLKDQLGQGGFGSVHSGKWRQTDVAVKLLNENISKDIMKEFHDEALVMSQINHPNVVLFLGLSIVPPMLIMELMPRGSVFKILHQDTAELHWTLKLQMALDAARGMNFLHTFKPQLIHRDLKSLNLLVARDWRVKVADFGLTTLQKKAVENTPGETRPSDKGTAAAAGETAGGNAAGAGAGAAGETKGEEKAAPKPGSGTQRGAMGTLAWTAPEAFAGQPITTKSDVYSFGVILYEILARKEPFKSKPVHAIPYLVLKGTRPDSIDPIDKHDKELSDMLPLMRSCWSTDRDKRPSFGRIIERLERIAHKQLRITSGTFEDHVQLPRLKREPSTPVNATSNLQAGFTVNMKDVELGPKIGRGGNAYVYEGRLQGTHVAVKELFVKADQDELVKEFQKECSLMLGLRHPNIVLFMGSGARSGRLYMITELMINGSLFQIYHNQRPDRIAMSQRLKMATDAARGMQYLHSLQPALIHRDLKSPNVLVDASWVAKIADFGLSRYKDDSKTMTTCGSPLWAAPEVLRGERFGEPCDVFSFAIILWELLAWEEPYQGMDSMQVMTQVARYQLRPPIPDYVEPSLKRLLRSMWNDNQHQRPTFEQVLTQLEDITAPYDY